MTAERRVALIVDDSETYAYFLGLVLERAGFETVHASTVAAGRALAERWSPSVACIDYLLPDATGDTLCQSLRSATSTRDCAIVLLSADPGLAATAKRMGADVFLPKTGDWQQLQRAIDAALAAPTANGTPLARSVRG
jgi:DNA-binding response OmpR family regulator